VGSFEGVSAAEELNTKGIDFQPVKTPKDGLTAITECDLDAFVDRLIRF